MAWTTPRTWVTNELVTAAIMNTHVRDNLNETIGAITGTDSSILIAGSGGSPDWHGASHNIDLTTATSSGNTTMTTSWANMVTGAYTVTSGWSTYVVQLMGFLHMEGGSNQTEYEARAGDGTNWGLTTSCRLGSNQQHSSLFAYYTAAEVSGNQTWAIQAQQVDPGSAGQMDHGTLMAIIYRET